MPQSTDPATKSRRQRLARPVFDRQRLASPVLDRQRLATGNSRLCLSSGHSFRDFAACRPQPAVRSVPSAACRPQRPPSSGDRLRSHSSENQWPSRRSPRFAVLWGPATPSSCDPIEPYQFPRLEGAASDRSSVLATSNRVRSAAGMRRFFFAGWPVDCPLPIAPLAEHSPRFLG